MTFIEELTRSLKLYLEVVVTDFEPQSYLLNFNLALVLLIARLLFGLLVTIFTIIKNLDYWRLGSRSDLS
jgi:hypothetical protein